MSIKVFCDKCDALIKVIQYNYNIQLNAYDMLLCKQHQEELDALMDTLEREKKQKIHDWKKNQGEKK